VLAEVVADEHVEQVRLATQVRIRHRDQLAVPGRRGLRGGAGEVVQVAGQDGGGHQQRCRGGGRCERQDLSGCVGMAADEARERSGVVVRHTCTLHRGADGALTTPDDRPARGRLA